MLIPGNSPQLTASERAALLQSAAGACRCSGAQGKEDGAVANLSAHHLLGELLDLIHRARSALLEAHAVQQLAQVDRVLTRDDVLCPGDLGSLRHGYPGASRDCRVERG
tara:strand:- start:282 stop:608 length:327 start_codon:yes stop_codon:yes gene_type:complete